MRRPSSIRATQNGGPKPYLDLLSLSAPESNSLADALALNKQAPTTRDRETGILNIPQRLDASALPKQMQNAYGRPAPHEFQFPLAGKRRLSGAAAARMRPDEGAAAGLRVRPPCSGPMELPDLVPRYVGSGTQTSQGKSSMIEIKEHMEVIGADGVHVGTVDKVEGNRIKLTRKDSGEGSHKGHHHYIDRGLVADVEGNKVRLSAIGAVAVTMEEEK